MPMTNPDHIDAVWEAHKALAAAAVYLSATDQANAEANLADVRYRPLTLLVSTALSGLLAVIEDIDADSLPKDGGHLPYSRNSAASPVGGPWGRE